MSDNRDRLIELIHDSDYSLNSVGLADYLLANGVMLPPCKAGDTIYFDTYKHGESIGIQPHKVVNISIVVSTERPFGCVGADIYDREFGKTVFLTYKEAENALKEKQHSKF